jgi:hypothetical protein
VIFFLHLYPNSLPLWGVPLEAILTAIGKFFPQRESIKGGFYANPDLPLIKMKKVGNTSWRHRPRGGCEEKCFGASPLC